MRLNEPSGLIICLVTCLLGVGMLMVYSSDWASSIGIKSSGYGVLVRHTIGLVIGVGAMVGIMWLGYWRLEPPLIAYIILGLAVFGLILVLIPGIGNVHGGARRWIRFGSLIGFQPSEFAKLGMILFLASWAANNRDRMHELIRGFLIPLAVIAGLTGLTVLEPDFGTATFMAALGMMIMVVAGTRWSYVGITAAAALPVIGLLAYLEPYRRARLLAFMDPWGDSSGGGYHLIQSWIALGSGGLTGKGLGEGHQKLLFLPESSGDFIFAVLGEETGFLGTFGVLAVFAVFVWQGLRVANRAKDHFGHVLALSVTFMIGYQAAFNMAVALGCVPTKGIALPFISSGGSSILSSLIAVGLLLSVARRYEAEGAFLGRPWRTSARGEGVMEQRPVRPAWGRKVFTNKKIEGMVRP
ncbi:MAG: putative lipid II flippase FtsW [Candidatus Brocadiales bacterium]|nr:putative lipid II flippase FtsW [Candidatus Bathyanammoxibius amoris]